MNHKKYHSITVPLLLLLALFVGSCEDALDPGTPTGQLPVDAVFTDAQTATAAVTTLYAQLRDAPPLTGNPNGSSLLLGLYADELDYYGVPGLAPEAFYAHTVTASNGELPSLWNAPYTAVYMANAALEGLAQQTVLPEELTAQLRGEALFVRALSHFYLTAMFGDIPYVTTTDAEVNAMVARLPVATVYEHLEADLMEAQSLLGDAYPSGERVRANRWVATALLARVYLYAGDWEAAARESGAVLAHTDLYTMGNDLTEAFLRGSGSALLQWKPPFEGENAMEGATFVFMEGPPPLVALRPELVAAFEAGDLRRSTWIAEVTDGAQVWYRPNKYSQHTNTGSSMEYSTPMRLAELYLIRAEAYAQVGRLEEARDDVNAVRQRAGLPNTPAATQEAILAAVQRERRLELFTEQGHRWFDLVRYGDAANALAPIKPGWRPTDVLLPLPETELSMNPNLAPQNPGY